MSTSKRAILRGTGTSLPLVCGALLATLAASCKPSAAGPTRAVADDAASDTSPTPTDAAAVPTAATSSETSSAADAGDAGDADAGTDAGAFMGMYRDTSLRSLRVDLSGGPLYFTVSFDGSRRFSMWLDTMGFARELAARHGKPVHFTYFINTCYYDLAVKGSKIGKVRSTAELLVRRALTQQAINEGHEIGNHGVRHDDGSLWSTGRWKAEFDEFHYVIERSLFKPLRRDDGSFAFPQFDPVADATAGAVGARCTSDADCDSKQCLPITGSTSFCTMRCNRHHKCPQETACGGPDFNSDTEVCVPVPRYPIEHQGEVLFDEHGVPNLGHPDLRPYHVVGWRAPHLAVNDDIMPVLLDRKYSYDASHVLLPSPPLGQRMADDPRWLMAFGLMTYPGSSTIPMDYNYFRAGIPAKRMGDDYRRGVVAAYQTKRRCPWNVGEHFSLWNDGAYWRELRGAVDFAAGGCPDDEGASQCPEIELVSFAELAERVAAELRRTGAGDAGTPSTDPPSPSDDPAAPDAAP